MYLISYAVYFTDNSESTLPYALYVCRSIRSLYLLFHIIISYSPSISSAVRPVIDMISFTS